MADLMGKLGDTFGFESWNIGGSGIFGKFAVFAFIVVIIVALVGFLFFVIRRKKVYKHKIEVKGMMGNQPMKKWVDRAREIPLGRAGDRLFYLQKKKRFLPYPTLQSGPNEWHYWEREDQELINISYENLDETQRKLGIRFVDTDMRMQRLGIEKNLQFRLQKINFWEKYGQTVVNALFYVIVTMFLIVIFFQLTKFVKTMDSITSTQGKLWEKIARGQEVSPDVPDSDTGGGSGLIPAALTLSLIKQGVVT